jgi:hypothetical protein
MKKKIFGLILLLSGFILIGCGEEMTPMQAVDDYLQRYITLDDSIMEQLDEFVNNEDLTDDQKKIYRDILKKQYGSLTYTLKNEKIDGDTAYVKADIKVIDLYKVQKKSLEYYETHKDEFNDDSGAYDVGKYLSYKLSQMKNATDTRNYEIEFKVVKEDGDWDVSQLSNDDLKKIHGIYEYEE